VVFAGCATTSTVTNTVSGTSWQSVLVNQSVEISFEISFLSESTFLLRSFGSEEGMYEDIDENGLGTLQMGDTSSRRGVMRLGQQLYYGSVQTGDLMMFDEVSPSSNPGSLMGSKWSTNANYVPRYTLSFSENGVVVQEIYNEFSGTYKYTNATTISVSIRDGNTFTGKVFPDELELMGVTWKRK
jgi:hypothetical protein